MRLRLRTSLIFPLCFFLVGSGVSVAQETKTPAQAPPSPAESEKPAPSTAVPAEVDLQQLYDTGKQLFDEYAPAEVKRDYEFPSQEQWDQFARRLQEALQGGSLEELAAFEPEVRQALAGFRMLPDYSDYVDWLTERLDLIETARAAVAQRKIPSPLPEPAEPGKPSRPEKTPAAVSNAVPYYDVWFSRLQDRPRPPRANELLPLLKVIFSAEGLPPELAWLAEVESSLNPAARSPAGARGLFQLMPATARSMGLSLMPFDERVQPGKNARAAAQLLHRLHNRFSSWPLAIAAYNAGEGRIAAALKKTQSAKFSDIAESLPAETRMYVPKVIATVAVRESVAPSALLTPADFAELKASRLSDINVVTATTPPRER